MAPKRYSMTMFAGTLPVTVKAIWSHAQEDGGMAGGGGAAGGFRSHPSCADMRASTLSELRA